MKTWNGKDLKGGWLFTAKLDGVRAIVINGKALSRAGKPLYNLTLPDGDYEIFKDNWETTVSLVRTKEGKPVPVECAYSLVPLDNRLELGGASDPTAAQIRKYLKWAIKVGYEGLVLRQENNWLKVKPVRTYDVPVLGVVAGKGKHEGRVGALETPKGRVGTGFSDKEREELLTIPLGTVIEVEAMGLTPAGKFRHPRFLRVRFDK